MLAIKALGLERRPNSICFLITHNLETNHAFR